MESWSVRATSENHCKHFLSCKISVFVLLENRACENQAVNLEKKLHVNANHHEGWCIMRFGVNKLLCFVSSCIYTGEMNTEEQSCSLNTFKLNNELQSNSLFHCAQICRQKPLCAKAMQILVEILLHIFYRPLRKS